MNDDDDPYRVNPSTEDCFQREREACDWMQAELGQLRDAAARAYQRGWRAAAREAMQVCYSRGSIDGKSMTACGEARKCGHQIEWHLLKESEKMAAHRIASMTENELRLKATELYEALDECMPIAPPKRLVDALVAFRPSKMQRLESALKAAGFSLGVAGTTREGTITVHHDKDNSFWTFEKGS